MGQQGASDDPVESNGTSAMVAPAGPAPRKYPLGARLAVGSIVSFAVASLLYGPSTVVTALFFATVCTVGIGLLLILAGCWLVGWVVLEVWSSVATSSTAQPTS